MKKSLFILLICGLIPLIVACSAASPTDVDEVDDEPYLTLYHTATLTPTITPTPLGQPTQTPKPTITPTPHIYEVRAGDQMLGIAWAFGITLEDLQAANPDVNPSLMSIGTRLVIPPPRGVTPTVAAPTPTPFDVTIGELDCLASANGGLHCFALVINERKNAATNLTGEFKLVDTSGETDLSRLVALPIKNLEPGARLPFYTYFAPALVEGRTVSFTLLTATRVNADDPRAYPLEVQLDSTLIAENGRSAALNGTLVLTGTEVELSQVTLVTVAYDANGKVVGLRRVEEQAELTAGATRPFNIQVFSIGGRIATVEIYAEGES